MTNIPAGMVPWAGGDAAPADWDGGEVLLRVGPDSSGQMLRPFSGMRWDHEGSAGDIIAYTPIAAPRINRTPDGGEVGIAAHAVRDGAAVYCWWETPDDWLQPLIMDLDVAAEFHAELTAALDIRHDTAPSTHVLVRKDWYKPLTMQDVRLAVGEGDLTPDDVLAGCNAELTRWARLAGVGEEGVS